MFGKKKDRLVFDKTGKHAVIHASICTGERVAGFKDDKTGRFEEIMLIRNDKDLEEFMVQYCFCEVMKQDCSNPQESSRIDQ